VSSSKHVLFLTSWLPGRHHPTNGNFILRHAEAVAKQGWKVSLLYITTGLTDQVKRVEIEYSNLSDVFVMKVYLKPQKGIGKGIEYIKSLTSSVNEIIKIRGPFDIIHGNIAINAGLFARIISLWKKTPYILSEHWSGYLPEVRKFKGVAKTLITKWVFLGAQAILPVSEYLSKSLQSHDLRMKRVIVIPNVVDSQLFKSDFVSKDQCLLVHVSMLEDKIKNVRGILRSFKQSLAFTPDARLVLIGQRPDNERLKGYSIQLGLKEPNFTFLDFLPITEVATYMREARALVLFSWYETLSAVVAEAQSSGTQVIASKVGGVPEACVENGAILVPAGDENELTQAMINVLTAPQSKEESKQISALAQTKFNEEAIGKRIVDVYSIVLNN
jgi:glycosyltransferase involved in cell wall biosynthesis